MCVRRTAEVVSVVSEWEVVVMFLTVEGEGTAGKIFRRAQNCINYEGWENKIKEDLKKI
jgi:hypothetical protein